MEPQIAQSEINNSVAAIYDVVGSSFFTQKIENEALQYFEKSKDIREQILPDSMPVAISYNNMGLVC